MPTCRPYSPCTVETCAFWTWTRPASALRSQVSTTRAARLETIAIGIQRTRGIRQPRSLSEACRRPSTRTATTAIANA